MKRQIQIGITGNIGSGKTLISSILIRMGYPVFNSDQAGKKILEGDPEVREKLVGKWGNSVLNGELLDRGKIASIVFSDEKELAFLNAIIHPKVNEAWQEFLKYHPNTMVFKEAAILIESGSYRDCQEVILVTCPVEERVRRVINRDHSTKEEVMKRMARQWPEEELSKMATYFIANDGGQLILPQLNAILNELNNKYA